MQETESGLYERLCDYDLLERVSCGLHLEMTQENEERLINLHNHLIWRSYIPGRDDAADAIFCAMIQEIAPDGAAALGAHLTGMQDAADQTPEIL